MKSAPRVTWTSDESSDLAQPLKPLKSGSQQDVHSEVTGGSATLKPNTVNAKTEQA